MYPINHKFVTYEKIYRDGEDKPLTVLVLDEEANEAYWKIVFSFGEFLRKIELKHYNDAVAWHISSAFAATDGYKDLLADMVNIEFGTPLSVNDHIYNIPISYIEDDRMFAVLELPESKLVENDLWK